MGKEKEKWVLYVNVYDGSGVDDGRIRYFNSLEDCIDYVFDELDGEKVELIKGKEEYTIEHGDTEYVIQKRKVVKPW